MSKWRVVFLGWWLLSLALIQSACAQTATNSTKPGEGIQYSYRLTINRNPKLCEHMGQVFNTKFNKLWHREPVPPTEDSSPYAFNGKFVFPRLEGVKPDQMKTFQMALSKLPSSPEFDAVGWKETRITLGGPPGVQIPESDTPLAALVASFDFDNDGQGDTVIKHGFTSGYEAIRDRAESAEYLAVWRSKTAAVPPNTSMWMERNADGPDRVITRNGQYLRPFIYRNRAYLAEYEMHFSDFESGKLGPYQVAKETMTVLDLRDTGAYSEVSRMPVWNETTICQFEMVHTN